MPGGNTRSTTWFDGGFDSDACSPPILGLVAGAAWGVLRDEGTAASRRDKANRTAGAVRGQGERTATAGRGDEKGRGEEREGA
jgi:hypothetical protein